MISADLYCDHLPHDIKLMFQLHHLAFLEKVKTGKAQASGSGFGGKGLDRLEKDRDAKSRAERSAYGEPGGEEIVKEEGQTIAGTAGATGSTGVTVSAVEIPELNVEVKRGPAPDSSRRSQAAAKPAPAPPVDVAATPALTAALKAAQAAAQAKGYVSHCYFLELCTYTRCTSDIDWTLVGSQELRMW